MASHSVWSLVASKATSLSLTPPFANTTAIKLSIDIQKSIQFDNNDYRWSSDRISVYQISNFIKFLDYIELSDYIGLSDNIEFSDFIG